jgi:tungstate transport system substrate-binding protein
VRRAAAVLALALPLVAGPVRAAERPFITVSSTTSTRDSGLLDYLLPIFESASGVQVRIIAVGTGQALQLGERGDVDAVLVHDRLSEDRFMARGDGLLRRDVMYNDFVVLGPARDPARIHGAKDAVVAFRRIAAAHAPFLSRGDDSGTNKEELRLWKAAGIDPRGASGTWYKETGSGQGATLNTAVELDAYTLVDRGTWISFRNKRDLRILVEGDPRLRNPYGVIVVNPQRHPQVKVDLARRFVDWLVSGAGQAAIASFRVDGQVLFHPDAKQGPPATPRLAKEPTAPPSH